jgi:hypothetical protein
MSSDIQDYAFEGGYPNKETNPPPNIEPYHCRPNNHNKPYNAN